MDNTFTIYPKDLTPECLARLNQSLKEASGENVAETNWDSFGCAEVVLPGPEIKYEPEEEQSK